jgi:hypothetical protein
MQKILWDRRLVLTLLDAIGVPTPHRLVASRDGGARVDPEISAKIQRSTGVKIDKWYPEAVVEMMDSDTISVNGQLMRKPFVEKPVSGEDHNVYVYYPKEAGGGGRKLFRKVRFMLLVPFFFFFLFNHASLDILDLYVEPTGRKQVERVQSLYVRAANRRFVRI